MSFRTLEDALLTTCNDVFGDDVEYTASGESAVTIKGVFDNAYVDVQGVVSLKPILRIKLSDLDASPGKGDSVSISEVDYRVLESREDAYGGSTLILQKV